MSEETAPKKRRRFRWNARDLKVLYYIGRYGPVTADRIRARFWSNDGTHNHYRRLRACVFYGLVDIIHADVEARNLYRLTKKGARLVQAHGLTPIPIGTRRPVYSSPYVHDEKLGRALEIFEGSPRIRELRNEFQARQELASRFGSDEKSDKGYKVPDALFEIQNSEGKWLKGVLELEFAPKGPKRWTRLIQRMAQNRTSDVTFFLFPSEARIETFRRMLEGILRQCPSLRPWRARHYLYFCTLPEFLAAGLDATWTGDGRPISLRNISQISNTQVEQTHAQPGFT